MNIIKILGEECEIIDTLEYITLADSFVKIRLVGDMEKLNYMLGMKMREHFLFGDMKNLDCFYKKILKIFRGCTR